jgi:hypothetical protein
MKAWEVVGWAYEADIHCPACAMKRFGSALENPSSEDTEGNPIHPIFAACEEAGDYCGDCGERLLE